MAKVSVIIPVYNVEKYLGDCLESIINQTLTDLEIICVNDGTPDNSRSILQEYADKDSRIKIIDKENGGLSSARNAGIKEATGEYIAFVDSDDWIASDFFEKLYNAAVKYKVNVACGNLIRKSETKERYIIKYNRCIVSKSRGGALNVAQLPYNNYVMNRIYKRDLLQKIKLNFEEGILFEDMGFSHKALYFLRTIVAVPDANYYYRDTPFSIVNTNCEQSQREYRRELYKASCFVRENDISVKRRKKYHFLEKYKYCLFGIPLWKVEKYTYFTRYYLFALIPVFEIIHNTWLYGKNRDYE